MDIRSIFERAGEHKHDAAAGGEDSHMVKHWLTTHKNEEIKPGFKIKVVSTFKDALTRQVAESVRIDRRGSSILNSKTEYSRCRLIRLTVERPEWEIIKEWKKQEKKEAEKALELVTINDEEDIIGNGTGSVWEMGRLRIKQKRKNQEGSKDEDKPKTKRRRMAPLDDWGGAIR